MTVAGAVVYGADRLTDGKAVTQAEVAETVETVVSTTTGKIKRYPGRCTTRLKADGSRVTRWT